MLKSPFLVLAVLMALLAPSLASAQSSGPATVYPLLVNASASGNLFGNVYGGNYQLNLAGTVGGATVTVTVSDASNTQQTVATFTATGTQCIAIPANANVQGIVAGGSPSGLYLKASGVQFCPAESATGTVTAITTPSGVTSTDASPLTITTGGSYQVVFAASATRKSCLIQNPPTAALQGIPTAEVLSIHLGVQTSVFTIPIGGTFSCANVDGTVVQDAILMTGATTAHVFGAVTQ